MCVYSKVQHRLHPLPKDLSGVFDPSTEPGPLPIVLPFPQTLPGPPIVEIDGLPELDEVEALEPPHTSNSEFAVFLGAVVLNVATRLTGILWRQVKV